MQTRMAHSRRITVESTFKYSPIPPHTPSSILSVSDLYNLFVSIFLLYNFDFTRVIIIYFHKVHNSKKGKSNFFCNRTAPIVPGGLGLWRKGRRRGDRGTFCDGSMGVPMSLMHGKVRQRGSPRRSLLSISHSCRRKYPLSSLRLYPVN